MISPRTALGHRALEAEVIGGLQERGFLVGNLAYHETLSDELQRRLQRVECPAALVTRTRSDRVVVHADLPACFFLELKTGTVRAAQDFMPELVQLSVHMAEALYAGAKTLYVYRNLHDSFESAFWVDVTMPRPACILIGRQRQHLIGYARFLAQFWPRLPVQVCNFPNSGDPCLRIPQGTLPQTAWGDLVQELMDGVRAGTLPPR